MAKLGRPEKPIDWEKFEELCDIQCTHDEIASMCKVAKSTLYERTEKQYGEDFPTIYKRFSEGGKCSLRRTQFKIAKKNCSMAIWLGKQYLGQKDKEETVTQSDKSITLKVNFDGNTVQVLPQAIPTSDSKSSQ